MTRLCTECRWGLLSDYGYSNYTTEGTNFFCLKYAHPVNDGFDHYYGKAEHLKFAMCCTFYEKGEPVLLDVDLDQKHRGTGSLVEYASDMEVAELLDIWADIAPVPTEPGAPSVLDIFLRSREDEE